MSRRQSRLPKATSGPGIARALALLAAAGLAGGCSTAAYYGQAIGGQAQIVLGKRDAAEVIAERGAAEGDALAGQLRLAAEIVAFAESEMGLAAKGSYADYIDLGRPHIVWSVVAAPEFSTEPKEWWYPFLGSLSYRGFFSEARAERFAAKLRARGLDVWVAGIDAYSTLGWFDDPLLNTFIDYPEHDLVALICHELSHQRLYVPGDTDFNEAFAVAVEREAQRRWVATRGSGGEADVFRRRERRRAELRAALFAARDDLAALYARAEADAWPAEKTRAAKAGRLDALRTEYRRLALRHSRTGNAPLADDLNNALLGSLATYYDLVPAFENLLAQCGGDLDAFYAEAERLGKLPADERRRLGFGH
ncbi:MAG: aminopeptidase [Verrucomicrobiales bacterium]